MTEVVLTKLSSKGQIVIPKALRKLLGLEPGELFAIFGEGDTLVLKKIEVPSDREFESLMEWGEEYASKNKITKEEVAEAVSETRQRRK